MVSTIESPTIEVFPSLSPSLPDNTKLKTRRKKETKNLFFFLSSFFPLPEDRERIKVKKTKESKKINSSKKKKKDESFFVEEKKREKNHLDALH